MRAILVGLVCGVCLVSPPVRAAESRPPLLVLDFETRGATALEGEAATRNAARGLRQLDVFQVLTSEDVRQLLALERTRQIAGVASGTALSGITTALGATHTVLGTVTRTGPAIQVELKLLDAKSNTVLSTKTSPTSPGIDGLAQVLPGLAQELMAPLLREQQGRLLVRAREEAAEVLVDDTLVSSTPMREPIALPRGAHRLQVRKDGFIAQTQSVRIEPDQVTTAEVNLLPSADYAEAWKLRHGRLRIGAYIATGAAVLALGGGLALDRLGTDPLYRTQFAPRQAVLLAAQGQAPQAEPTAVASDPEAHQTWLACTADLPTCDTRARALGGQLFLQQLATGGLVVVGLAAGTVATYLWLTGQDPNRYANVAASVSLTDHGAGFALQGRF